MNETSFSLSPAFMRKLVSSELSLTLVTLALGGGTSFPRETILLCLIPFSLLLSLIFINDLRKLPWTDKTLWYIALVATPVIGHILFVSRRKKWFETRPVHA